MAERGTVAVPRRRLPSDLDAVDDVTVECRKLPGLGWDVGDASLTADADASSAAVDLELVWEAPAYTWHFTRCRIAVLDAQGREIGAGEHWLPGPKGGEPPFTSSAVVATEADAASAASLDAHCEPVSGDAFETREPGALRRR